MWVGADAGGTFTDLVTEDGRLEKVLSTPEDPALALSEGVGALRGTGPRPAMLAHGTTVATNALLERRGATVALLVNRGFADLVEIARQDRPSLYDQFADRPEPLVPRHLRLEVDGRLDAAGRELEALGRRGVPEIPAGVESVAVCLLHADLDPAHERAVAAVLRGRGLDVSCSSEVSPEFREYERAVTTILNSYLRPACRGYVAGLAGLADEVLVMTSAGSLVPVALAAELPVALLLSGPAGGALAAAAAAAAVGYPEALTLDMGGTSTDVCLVRGGVPEAAGSRTVAGFPVRLPSLDIHTIGAGGGSIAKLDPGAALTVGPRSAGAMPGPACYGRGGFEATVTDADLVLGRLSPEAALPGLGRLDVGAAVAALRRAGVTAAGVVAVVDAAMERALRVVSVQRGVDPRDLALVAFGGAGPLHACALAEALRMSVVVVPPRAGALSAVGLLGAPRARQLVRSWPTPGVHEGLAEALRALGAEVAGLLDRTSSRERKLGLERKFKSDPASGGPHRGPLEVVTGVDCRYRGQSHEVTVPDLAAFPEEHHRRNGYARADAPVEVVALRATAMIPSSLSLASLPAPTRRRVVGPGVIAEPDCTIWVPEGWVGEPAAGGALVLSREPRGCAL